MKYLLILLLIGCSAKDNIQSNISQFTHNCEALAKCMELDYKVEIDVTSERQPLICKIQFSDITQAYIEPQSDTDIEAERPTWGYLQAAIKVCKMLKKKGSYTDLEQNREHRFNNCVKLDRYNPDHKQACWVQYKEDDGK